MQLRLKRKVNGTKKLKMNRREFLLRSGLAE